MVINTINEKSLDAEILDVLNQLKADNEAPEWMTTNGLKTLVGGYLLPGETPKDMYRRVSNAAAKRLNRADLEARFFHIMWNGFLGLSTPVAANMGAERGLPISCFSSYVDDTVYSIFDTIKEVACMSAKGGGTSMYWGAVRPENSSISSGGTTNGIVPWLQVVNNTINSVTQGNVRRGALANYIDIEHGDFLAVLKTLKPTDFNYTPNLQLGVCVSDRFMQRLKDKDPDAILRWKELLTARWNFGKCYILFIDTVNRNRPECYKHYDLKVVQSNLCSEISLTTDKNHSLVCCLSSLNVALYDSWPEDLIELSIYFLDAVMEEFLVKSKDMPGFERAYRSAVKGRALGLGVIGYHCYLQDHLIPYESERASEFNISLFKGIREQADAATAKLAAEYGEPEWCKDFNRRNTHTLACAPTVSNSLICGEVSPGIDPITSAVFVKDRGDKGELVRYNLSLKKYLASIGRDTPQTWKEIREAAEGEDCSVQHLTWMPDEIKEVFKTAREINQLAVVKAAAERQPYLDQTQSVNLFFKKDVDQRFFQKVHIEAYKLGVHSLYYCRSERENRMDKAPEVNTSCAMPAKPPVEEDSVCIPCQG